MRRWEHKVVVHSIVAGQRSSDILEDREREEILDRYGRDGWELVSVVLQSYRRETDALALYGYAFMNYFFKRELPDEPEEPARTSAPPQ
jgi:hypothetical protein